MAQNSDNGNEILLKENVLWAIKVIRENKKRPDCQSICHYINKFTDSKTNTDYLYLVIQSLLDSNNIVNKPTKQGLPSYYIINEMTEDLSDDKSEADFANENPIIFEHILTPKLKETESDLTPKKCLNDEKHECETIENLKNSVLNINAEIRALKNIIHG